MAEHRLTRHDVEGVAYWSGPGARVRSTAAPLACLLPMYDEYLIAYKDRSAAFDRRRSIRTWPDSFSAAVVVDGFVVAAWRRTFATHRLLVTVTPIARLTRTDVSRIEDAARAYAGFMDARLELSFLR
jgi:hypothetical protein